MQIKSTQIPVSSKCDTTEISTLLTRSVTANVQVLHTNDHYRYSENASQYLYIQHRNIDADFE